MINFPINPTANQRFTSNGLEYTWDGNGWIAAAAPVFDGTGAHTVGDLKESLLTEAQFLTANGATEAAKWMLCDGRSCAGTLYATATGNATVPDLRGRFLRMTGGDAAALNTAQGQATKAPTTPFTAASNGAHNHSMNDAGNHAHNAGIPTWDDGQGYIYGRDTIGSGKRTSNWDSGNATANPWTSTNGSHRHDIQINGAHTHTISGGDNETRPVNYSVNFFLRVNN